MFDYLRAIDAFERRPPGPSDLSYYVESLLRVDPDSDDDGSVSSGPTVVPDLPPRPRPRRREFMLASYIDWDDVHVHDDPAALERPPLLLQDSHSRAQWQIVTDSGGSGDNSSGDGISANSGDHGHDNSSVDGSSDGISANSGDHGHDNSSVDGSSDGNSANSGDHGHDNSSVDGSSDGSSANSSDDGSSDGSSDDSSGDSSSGSSVIGPHPQAQ